MLSESHSLGPRFYFEQKCGDSILFAGALNFGGLAEKGAVAKNRHLLHFFTRRFGPVATIDMDHFRKRPLVLIRLFFEVLRSKRARVIILSSSAQSACLLARALRVLRIERKIFYWVLGGDLPDNVRIGVNSVEDLGYFSKIIVEGKLMQDALIKLGVSNTMFVPNCKEMDYFPELPRRRSSRRGRFVFISRVTPEKGVKLILESVEKLKASACKSDFSVDIFGTIDSCYEQEFLDRVNSLDNVSYRGFLDLEVATNYDVLAAFDVMLFPTYFSGEGFPGVLIDAFVAGLPVVASDWSLNAEVIRDGVTGVLIPARDVNALALTMQQVLKGYFNLDSMSAACQQQAKQYAIERVLHDELLVELGMLES